MIDEAQPAIQAALQSAGANQDATARRDALFVLTMIQSEMGQHDAGLRTCAIAMEIFTASTHLSFLLTRTYALASARQPAQAHDASAQALQMARAQGDCK